MNEIVNTLGSGKGKTAYLLSGERDWVVARSEWKADDIEQIRVIPSELKSGFIGTDAMLMSVRGVTWRQPWWALMVNNKPSSTNKAELSK